MSINKLCSWAPYVPVWKLYLVLFHFIKFWYDSIHAGSEKLGTFVSTSLQGSLPLEITRALGVGLLERPLVACGRRRNRTEGEGLGRCS